MGSVWEALHDTSSREQNHVMTAAGWKWTGRDWQLPMSFHPVPGWYFWVPVCGLLVYRSLSPPEDYQKRGLLVLVVSMVSRPLAKQQDMPWPGTRHAFPAMPDLLLGSLRNPDRQATRKSHLSS